MSKHPQFPFYVNNWIGGTMRFTLAEKGAYIDLLCLQFNGGPFTEEEASKYIGPHEFEEIWKYIADKFEVDGEGKYYNSRLALEMDKQAKLSNAQKEKAEKRWKDSGTSPASVRHMPRQSPETSLDTDTDIDIDNNNEKEVIKKKTPRKCLLKNSGITLQDVAESFLATDDLKRADAKVYYNKALDWSDGGGHMRIDWIAVIRSWARRDLQEGKIVYRKTGGVKPDNPHLRRIESEQHIPANPERAKKLAEDLSKKYGDNND